jgi:hypothetical protein
MTPEPHNDPELERQRTDIETAFRERWLPLDVSKPRILTEHVYAEAHQFIDQGGGTWLDEAIIQAHPKVKVKIKVKTRVNVKTMINC